MAGKHRKTKENLIPVPIVVVPVIPEVVEEEAEPVKA